MYINIYYPSDKLERISILGNKTNIRTNSKIYINRLSDKLECNSIYGCKKEIYNR